MRCTGETLFIAIKAKLGDEIDDEIEIEMFARRRRKHWGLFKISSSLELFTHKLQLIID